jgi:hypothetical protein
MPILDLLLGRTLASDEAGAEQVGASAGIQIFALDVLLLPKGNQRIVVINVPWYLES